MERQQLKQIEQIVTNLVVRLRAVVEEGVRTRVLNAFDVPKNGHAVKKPKPPVQAKFVVHEEPGVHDPRPLAVRNHELQRKKWREAKRKYKVKMRKAAK